MVKENKNEKNFKTSQSSLIFQIIKLCFTPFSIISPIPFFCFILFLIANEITNISINSIFLLCLGIATSLISSGATNFWNHTNDLKEDICNNKKTILTTGVISQRNAVIISLLLYVISIILVIFASCLLNRPIYLFFIVWAVISWWYSDSIFINKITGFRLKTHYKGELLTYGLAYPAYTMSIWLIFSDSLTKGFVLSLIFLCFGIAGVFLKDLKDIEGDRKAGLKTFGVIFTPSKLIKLSCICLIIYFSTIIIAANSGILNYTTCIVIIPFIYLIKKTYLPFERKQWTLEIGDHKNIKAMMLSTYSSLVILGFINFI